MQWTLTNRSLVINYGRSKNKHFENLLSNDKPAWVFVFRKKKQISKISKTSKKKLW